MDAVPEFLQSLFDEARILAQKYKHQQITVYHLAYILATRDPILLGLDQESSQLFIVFLHEKLSSLTRLSSGQEFSSEVRKILANASTLIDMNTFALQLTHFILPLKVRAYLYRKWVGDAQKIDALLDMLINPLGHSLLITGPHGVGKTAILFELIRRKAFEWIRINVQEYLDFFITPKNVYENFQNRLFEAERTGKVLILDDMHLLDSMWLLDTKHDILDLMAPFLYRGSIRVLATALPDFIRSPRFEKGGWHKFFTHIELMPPVGKACQEILEYCRSSLSKGLMVRIDTETVQIARKHAHVLFPEYVEPGNVVRLLCMAYSRKDAEDMILSQNDVYRLIRAKEEPKKKRTVEEIKSYLSRYIFGQDEVIERITNRLRFTRERLDRYPQRPDGVFLFLGPSGVGKTETARRLAEAVYGGRDALVKFDMSEFMEKHTVSRLLGPPPGYIGFDQKSYLEQYLSSGTDCVILLDEIEKAHPDVLHIFLQIFDEGVLTDSAGVKWSFSETIFVLTSNAGNTLWQKDVLGRTEIGFTHREDNGKEQQQKVVNRILMQFFLPEFLNRLDDIILFKPLSEEALLKIVEFHLKRAVRHMRERFGINFKYTDTFITWLAQKDYEPAFGARHVLRNVETYVIGAVLRAIAEGRLKVGDTYELDIPSE